MGLKEHRRHSKAVTHTRRWQVLRMAVLERDCWACVDCGERKRLEVDHVKPVRAHPHLAFDPQNCAARCGRCHSRKTRIEIGLGRPDPKRDAWKKLVRETRRNPVEQEV